MSFSSDIKQQLTDAEPKKQCCADAVNAGKELAPFLQGCDKDAGMYLRGVFLKYGSISAPGRNFMLSFSLPKEEATQTVFDMLCDWGMEPKQSVRRGKPIIYFKAAESIEDVLSFMGATKAALDIINTTILNDVRNNMNRICNAETANMDRTARAAAEQCEAIKTIIKYGALQNLPAELRECAEIRLANPDMSLAQIRNLLSAPVSKSGLNHRFRKLIEIAESYNF